ncbi:MAG: hypothetical protein AAF645_04260 [Myxococcota bacterium]
MSRIDRLESISLRLARVYAALVQWVHGKRRVESTEELADEWNRLMPSPREAFPIVDVQDETAFVEIRIKCPLRGSGDGEACWRSMEFDRALVSAAGGRLVVMESQAVTGGDCCRLAIRRDSANMDDLPVAHPRWRERP